ncbi:MAG TPA: DUF3099 domain-containing protein [Candidatus Corynebacterium avicola]|uniref:DUF3099 domain-containing protein n=1 Tax=Candidatus Corynebacterium avicola TaxID=2838527 RepID=A0A9D1ULS5_9CORY|nr:DUF3099 domain-containing protein [Candidatus Corynebacterium avicola]
MPDNEDATERHDDGRDTGRPQQSHHSRQSDGDSGDAVSLITTAKKPRLDDWRHRKRVYAGLQLARIPLLVFAVIAYAWLHSPVLAALIAVISLPLPWIAVLLANEKASDTEKGQPKVYKPALVRQQNQAMQASLESDAGARRAQLNEGDSTAHTPEVIDAEEPEDTDSTEVTEDTEDTEDTARNENSDER